MKIGLEKACTCTWYYHIFSWQRTPHTEQSLRVYRTALHRTREGNGVGTAHHLQLNGMPCVCLLYELHHPVLFHNRAFSYFLYHDIIIINKSSPNLSPVFFFFF